MSSRFERTGGEEVLDGEIFSVWRDTFRHDDGVEVVREVVRHPGAVGILAYDDDVVWLVRQPREVTGVPDLLEIPAGKLDVEGEPPLKTAQRELAEEIGKAAEHWEHLHAFYTSPGFADERYHVFAATGLSDAVADSGEDERIDVVRWPLDALDEAIAQCEAGPSLAALLLLQLRLR